MLTQFFALGQSSPLTPLENLFFCILSRDDQRIEVNAACSHAPSFVRFTIATNCNQSTTIVKQSPRHFHRSGDPPPSRSYIPPAVSGSMRFFSNVERISSQILQLITRAQLSKHPRRALKGTKKALTFSYPLPPYYNLVHCLDFKNA